MHIDHTKIDVEVRLPNGRTRSRRAWLSLAIDAFSRRVLSAILLWDPPSHRTCMLIIRQMIKRWGRVPNTIVVDGGSEFRSVYFELLLATLKIKKKTRPGSKARAGSVIERLFGISEKEFWHNLLGNTKATKRNVRTVTPETDPKANAVWNLPALQMAADHYFGITYDGNHHGGLGMKPCEAYAQGIAQWGERKHMRWVFNAALEILTMPSPKNPTPMVVPGRGVKINYEYFWSPVFRSGKVEGKRVPVRYDPYDASRAWAHVDGKWHPLKGQHIHLFAGLSQRATKILTDQMRENARAAGRRLTVNAARLADFLRRTTLTEEFLLQVEQETDQASVLMQIFGPGSITGTPASWTPPAPPSTPNRTSSQTPASAKRPPRHVRKPPTRLPRRRSPSNFLRSFNERIHASLRPRSSRPRRFRTAGRHSPSFVSNTRCLMTSSPSFCSTCARVQIATSSRSWVQVASASPNFCAPLNGTSSENSLSGCSQSPLSFRAATSNWPLPRARASVSTTCCFAQSMH